MSTLQLYNNSKQIATADENDCIENWRSPCKVICRHSSTMYLHVFAFTQKKFQFWQHHTHTLAHQSHTIAKWLQNGAWKIVRLRHWWVPCTCALHTHACTSSEWWSETNTRRLNGRTVSNPLTFEKASDYLPSHRIFHTQRTRFTKVYFETAPKQNEKSIRKKNMDWLGSIQWHIKLSFGSADLLRFNSSRLECKSCVTCWRCPNLINEDKWFYRNQANHNKTITVGL